MHTLSLRAGGPTLIAALAAATFAAMPTMVRSEALGPAAQSEIPARMITLSLGTGQLVRLGRPMTGMFVADPKVADVQVKGPDQLYVFAKTPGTTSIYATDRSGTVIWSTEVRVGNNVTQVGTMLREIMPEQDITTKVVGGMVMLTGTVLSPRDGEEAQHLAESFVGTGVQVINRLKVATPQQVSLHVKIAEVSRDLVKAVGVNFASGDSTSGFKFGIGQGRVTGPQYTPGGPLGTGVTSGSVGTTVIKSLGTGTTFGLAGKLLGLDLLSALDLAETDGLVTTLAEPNLTTMSGETASFLAGGEIPIPLSQGLGAVSVEYKQYGVSLSFTPIVMSGGRISLRVRPEVSQLTSAGSVSLNGFTIPGITTRRVETTVELGSGQAFMIGGLLSNNANNSVDKVPGLGNVPILGALFRSTNFRKQQTELVVIVTPYLVKPVDANAVKLPTDGYQSPTDVERVLLGKTVGTKSNAPRPVATVAGAPSGASK